MKLESKVLSKAWDFFSGSFEHDERWYKVAKFSEYSFYLGAGMVLKVLEAIPNEERDAILKNLIKEAGELADAINPTLKSRNN